MLEGWYAAYKIYLKKSIQEDKNPYKSATVQMQAKLEGVPLKGTAFFLIVIAHPRLVLSLDRFTKYSIVSKTPPKEQRAKWSVFIMKKGSRGEGAKEIGSLDQTVFANALVSVVMRRTHHYTNERRNE